MRMLPGYVSPIVLWCAAFAGFGCASDRADSPIGGTGAGNDTDGADPGDDGGGDGGDRLDVGGGGEGGPGDGGIATTCKAAAEDNSSMGCRFWAIDAPNAWKHSIISAPDTPIPQEQQYGVVVTNASFEQSAKVDVYLGGDLIDSASVGINEIHRFELPRNDINPQQSSTDGTAFYIESDVPIAVYQFQPLDNVVGPFSNDATLLFPEHSYAQDYMAVTSYATRMTLMGDNNATNLGSWVAVVAIEDGTTVDLYPTAELLAGSPTSATIDRGEVFTVLGEGGGEEGRGNLSGTRVSADKPVTVFSGNVGAHEPLGVSGCCMDHIEHQMLPMTAWSNVYVATPPPRYDGHVDEWSTVRIVGAFDGTTLEYSPKAPDGAPDTIDAQQMAEFVTNEPFVVTGSEVFSVTQFLHSNTTLGHGGSVPGDPAMWVIPAVDQYQAKYVFMSPPGYSNNFLTVVGPVATSIKLDGEQVTGQFNSGGEIDGVPYLHIHVPVPPGPHVLEAADPVGISVFGYDKDVSYAFPGGSGIKYIVEPPPPPQG